MDCKDRPELVGRLGQCAALRGLAASLSLPIASKKQTHVIIRSCCRNFITDQTN
jgi:hypothetical protein